MEFLQGPVPAPAALSFNLVILARVPSAKPEFDTLAFWSRRFKANRVIVVAKHAGPGD
jgi:hypothetical protein